MRARKARYVLQIVCFILLLLFSTLIAAQTKLNGENIKDIAVEAYIYGYPLVLMDTTKNVMTNVTAPMITGRAPINEFSHTEILATPKDKNVRHPNLDMLYSAAWLDVSKEPMILHVPKMQDRYYIIQLIDAWSNIFSVLGTRTTGSVAKDVAIVGPGWSGKLPSKIEEIKSPTSLVWVIGRIAVKNEADISIVRELQQQLSLMPMSGWGNENGPLSFLPVNLEVDVKTPPLTQVANQDALTFYKQFLLLLKDNPPLSEDKVLLKKMASIGMLPGEELDNTWLNKNGKEILTQAMHQAKIIIAAAEARIEKEINGWRMTLKTGQFGKHYLDRAANDFSGLGANLPEDAVYARTELDKNRKKLQGKNHYIIHFSKDNIPPVNAFWSLTLYDDHHRLVENKLHRYIIKSDTLKYNKDGSLDIFIQYDSPGKEKESNWLPSPQNKFNLVMRLYWPKETVLNGQWKPVAVKKV